MEVYLKSTRDGFGDGISLLGEKHEDVVVLTADLKESTKVDSFSRKFPDRFIEIGISEQNMAGIAAGLALSGKVPFMSSYAEFSPGRNWEQIKLAICYSNTNVKIIGSHQGLSPSRDGATHQALEDIALTRVLPNMVVLNPIDYYQTRKFVKLMHEHNGPVYMRLTRDETEVLTKEKDKLEIGKAYTLTSGSDITILTTGTITQNVLKTAKALKEKNNISAEVIAFPTIKPLDKDAILKSVSKTNLVVTVEEHQKACGFGSSVCEFLSENLPTKSKIIGINDVFGQSGSYDELLDHYGLSTKELYKTIYQFYKQNK